MVATFFTKELYSYSFCISNNCLDNYYNFNKYSLDFFVSSITILSYLATAIGIAVAIMTFVNTKDTNALNSHISHFKIFTDYVDFEVRNKDLIDMSNINIFTWYNLIFANSIDGSVEVSKEYADAIDKINQQIEVTNNQSTKASKGPFRYDEHQSRIIKALRPIGINIQRAPKNDFIIIEKDVLSLIQTINMSFCHRPKVKDIKKAVYYG